MWEEDKNEWDSNVTESSYNYEVSCYVQQRISLEKENKKEKFFKDSWLLYSTPWHHSVAIAPNINAKYYKVWRSFSTLDM